MLRWSAVVGVGSNREGAALRVLEILPAAGLHILTLAGIPVGPLWFGSASRAIRYAEAEYCAETPVLAVEVAPTLAPPRLRPQICCPAPLRVRRA